jgi:two-component system response regulator (stage 0 sporulation protein F)
MMELVSRFQILLVDDDASCLASMESLLEAEGHITFSAAGGLEALRCARRLKEEKVRLDLSILDYNMPDLSGIETYERLRLEFPEVPAIFVSGDGSERLEDTVRRAGAASLVRKPLDVFRLRSAINELGGLWRGPSRRSRPGEGPVWRPGGEPRE